MAFVEGLLELSWAVLEALDGIEAFRPRWPSGASGSTPGAAGASGGGDRGDDQRAGGDRGTEGGADDPAGPRGGDGGGLTRVPVTATSLDRPTSTPGGVAPPHP
jgi:hypothetical protein